MVTVGYGDISPTTSTEKIIIIVITIISCGVFAYAVNTIDIIVRDTQMKEAIIKMKKFKVSTYMSRRHISKEKQMKVIKSLEYIQKQEEEENIEGLEILKSIERNIQDNILQEYFGKVLKECKLTKIGQYSKEFLNQMSLKMQECTVSTGTTIYQQGKCDERFFILIEGSLEILFQNKNGTESEEKVITNLRGKQDIVYKQFYTQQPYEFTVRSKHVSRLVYFELSDFIEEIKRFPHDYQKFCNIKDNLLFNFTQQSDSCFSCHSWLHSSLNCPFLHLSLFKSKIICIANMDVQNERKRYYRRQKCKIDTQIFHTVGSFEIDWIREELMRIRCDIIEEQLQEECVYDVFDTDIEFFYYNPKIIFFEQGGYQVIQQTDFQDEQYFEPYLDENGFLIIFNSDQDTDTDSDQSQRKSLNTIKSLKSFKSYKSYKSFKSSKSIKRQSKCKSNLKKKKMSIGIQNTNSVLEENSDTDTEQNDQSQNQFNQYLKQINRDRVSTSNQFIISDFDHITSQYNTPNNIINIKNVNQNEVNINNSNNNSTITKNSQQVLLQTNQPSVLSNHLDAVSGEIRRKNHSHAGTNISFSQDTKSKENDQNSNIQKSKFQAQQIQRKSVRNKSKIQAQNQNETQQKIKEKKDKIIKDKRETVQFMQGLLQNQNYQQQQNRQSQFYKQNNHNNRNSMAARNARKSISNGLYMQQQQQAKMSLLNCNNNYNQSFNNFDNISYQQNNNNNQKIMSQQQALQNFLLQQHQQVIQNQIQPLKTQKETLFGPIMDQIKKYEVYFPHNNIDIVLNRSEQIRQRIIDIKYSFVRKNERGLKNKSNRIRNTKASPSSSKIEKQESQKQIQSQKVIQQ